MISEADYYGGAIDLGNNVVFASLHPERAFFYRFDPAIFTGSPDFSFQLPPVLTNPHHWKQYEGRPMFAIWRDGAGHNPTIRTNSYGTGSPGSAVQVMSTNNTVYIVSLVDAATDTWTVETSSINSILSPTTVGSLTIDAPVVKEAFSPFCFEGTPCEFLRDQDNVPLDGAGGRDHVCVPFFEDPQFMVKTTYQNRDPVRAADLYMPKLVYLSITDGEFTEDTNHPLNGVESLGSEFYDALYGREGATADNPDAKNPWVLEYDSSEDGTLDSSNPYHMRASGSPTLSWTHSTGSGVPVYKYVWKATKTYGPPEEPDKYTLEVRLVAEVSLGGSEITSANTAGQPQGGIPSLDYGVLGTLFSFYVFTDEIEPTWVDGVSTFQPNGFSGAHAFTRDDPFVAANAAGVGLGGGDDKGAHPQLVAAALLPTSLHAPENLAHRATVDYATLYNWEEARKLLGGSPWTDHGGACTQTTIRYTDAEDFNGIAYNTVFGSTVGFNRFRPMTLGGDFPASSPVEWLCWENGRGQGTFFLQPANPGWEEECSRLTLTNSGEVAICVNDGDNSDSDDGFAWTSPATPACFGNQAEPFDGEGGSHQAVLGPGNSGAHLPPFADFLTNGPDVYNADSSYGCCFRLGRGQNPNSSRTQVVGHSYCILETTVHGEPQPASNRCEIVDGDCNVIGTYWARARFGLESYSLPFSADWEFWGPDEESVGVRDFSGSEGTWSGRIGTIGQSSQTFTVTGTGGSSAVRAMEEYDFTTGGSRDWTGFRVTANLDPTSGDIGIGMGYEETTNDFTGVLLHLTAESGGNTTATVKRYDDGVVAETLASEVLTASSSMAASIEMDGTYFTATVGTLSFSGDTYYEGMETVNHPVVAAESGTGGVANDVVVTDIHPEYLIWASASVSGSQMEGSLSNYIVTSRVDEFCPVQNNPDCCAQCCDDDEPVCCNCESWFQYQSTWFSASKAEHPSLGWQPIRDGTTVGDGCTRTDTAICGEIAGDVYDNPTGRLSPNPFRCRCEGELCGFAGDPCDVCLGVRPGCTVSWGFDFDLLDPDRVSGISPACPHHMPNMCNTLVGWAANPLFCI